MKRAKQIKELWKRYGRECDNLWVIHRRTLPSPPPERYDHEKDQLKRELEEDIRSL